jgi:hypothetical protein
LPAISVNKGKTMKHFLTTSKLSLAALAVAGASITGCKPPEAIGRLALSGSPTAMLIEGGEMSGSGLSVPDGSIILKASPKSAGFRAPSNIHLGTRFTYFYGMSNSVGSGIDWQVDEDGEFFDPKTGTHYSPGKKTGQFGAVGYWEYTVVGMDQDTVALELRQFSIGINGVPQLINHSCLLGQAGYGGGLWAPQQILAKVPDRTSGSLRITHQPYQLPSGSVDTVWFNQFDSSGCTTNTFDLKSGVLIHCGTVGSGQASPVHLPNENNTGNTVLTTMRLLTSEDTVTPWANDAAPEWTKSIHRMNFTGKGIVAPPAGMRMEVPARSTFEVTQRHGNWVQFKVTTLQGQPGRELPSMQLLVTGPSSFDPLWIPPAALARLQKGQVISQNRQTQEIVTVDGSARGPKGDMVVLTDANSMGGYQLGYDMKTGALTTCRFVNSALHTQLDLVLQSTE